MSKYINDYEKTDKLAVDMVASIVSHYRRHILKTQRGLKTIYLSPKLYYQFCCWTLEKLEDKEPEIFTFEGVEIKENSVLMGEQVYFDFYDIVETVKA